MLPLHGSVHKIMDPIKRLEQFGMELVTLALNLLAEPTSLDVNDQIAKEIIVPRPHSSSTTQGAIAAWIRSIIAPVSGPENSACSASRSSSRFLTPSVTVAMPGSVSV